VSIEESSWWCEVVAMSSNASTSLPNLDEARFPGTYKYLGFLAAGFLLAQAPAANV
jgi:hypothetical protein